MAPIGIEFVMQDFVSKDSVVRKIWGKSDTILVIFAGAAAEFALSKAVDWLYFTGRLPSDPLGRLFSTVAYARKIVFSSDKSARQAIGHIAAIHQGVESRRGDHIPDWAYRDVLFMLIDYSIRSFELLERSLTHAEKEEVFDVFYRVGSGMGIKDLPRSFSQWQDRRMEQLSQNLENSNYTCDLFRQYRRHLGPLRYRLMLELQRMVVPALVRKMLGMGKISLIKPLLGLYKLGRLIQLDRMVKALLLPAQFKAEIHALDVV